MPELLVEGEPRVITGGVAVAVYRIVQEAWADGALELEITDDGPLQDGAERDAQSGRRIAGMRERAAMYGGTLEAHPGADRGYVVRARVRLESSGA